jgi:hypothetical protein
VDLTCDGNRLEVTVIDQSTVNGTLSEWVCGERLELPLHLEPEVAIDGEESLLNHSLVLALIAGGRSGSQQQQAPGAKGSSQAQSSAGHVPIGTGLAAEASLGATSPPNRRRRVRVVQGPVLKPPGGFTLAVWH